MAILVKNQINSTFDELKKSVYKYITPRWTRKFENNNVRHITPIIDVINADKILHHNPFLHKVIRVLSQDVILNNYTLDIPDIQNKVNDMENDFEPPTPEMIELDRFNKFWTDNNKFQFYLAAQEYYTFGYGACEVRYDANDEPVLLEQIPAMSLKIRVKEFDGHRFCYVEQDIDGDKKLLRISHPDDSKGTDYSYIDLMGYDDKHVGTALWIGGGTTNTWYAEPYWLDANTSVLTQIYIDELNYQKISNGNIPSGLLLFSGSYRKGQEDIERQLNRQLSNAGAGTAMVYIKGATPDAKLTTDYIKIEDDNYQYLTELRKECIGTILECFGVPKVRLMIDDITESMNSNKSETIYEIYNKSIQSEQNIFKEVINYFNEDELGLTYQCIMDTPEFNDKTQIRINSVIGLFEQGLLTLGQAVAYLSRLLPEVNFDSLMDSPEANNCRYYRGKILGSEGATNPEYMDATMLTQELQQKLEEAAVSGLF